MGSAYSLNSPIVFWRFVERLESSRAACVVCSELDELSFDTRAICSMSLLPCLDKNWNRKIRVRIKVPMAGIIS